MRLPFWKSCLFSLLATGLVLLVLEGILALAGVPPARLGHDPLVGFAPGSPLFVPDGTNALRQRVMSTAPAKRRFFNAQSFVSPKPAGTVRIFCPGESTTYGHPYRDPTSFSGWLRDFLPAVAPATGWDVINAGGISYASYRLAAMMQELVRYQPDVFILYVGHNEFLEARTYADMRAPPAWRRALTAAALRTRAAEVLLDARDRATPPATGLSGEVNTILDQSVGPSAYHRDDTQQLAIVTHYALNVRRMIALARGAGADVILVLPAASLRDCSPFKSEASPGLTPSAALAAADARTAGQAALRAGDLPAALASLTAAVQADPRHAGGHYLLAEALRQAGRPAEARTHYARARDEDIVPVRAVAPLLDAVRRVAADTGVPLIDYPALLEADARARGLADDIPGAEQFLDHVHPTIDANRLLAEALVAVLRERGHLPADAVVTTDLRDRVATNILARVDRREQGLALRNVAKVLSWAGKTGDAARLARQAMADLGDDAESHFVIALDAQERGDWQAAEDGYRQAMELEPTYVKAVHNRGIALAHLDRLEEAVALYRRVLEQDPEHPSVHYNLGRALYRLEEDDAALAAFTACLERNPADADVLYYCAMLQLARGENAAARDAAVKALAIAPGDQQLRDLLAELDAADANP